MNARFTPMQRRRLIVCVAVYTTAYFCRLNLSAAFSLLPPAINFVGMLPGFNLRRRGDRAHSEVCLMMLAAGRMNARYWRGK